MNNFGFYKLFSRLNAKKKNNLIDEEKILNADFLSSLLKNLDFDKLISLLSSSAPNKNSSIPKPQPQKKKNESIDTFIKSHDEFVKRVIKGKLEIRGDK